MLKKVVSALLAVLMLNLGIFAFSETTKEAKFAEKVRSKIVRLGTGTDAQIKVKLKDGTKLKGYVREANDEQFVVVDSETGQATSVSYSNIRQAQGNNLSKKAVGFIVVGAIFAALIIILATQSK